jgi:hypothetical protein
VIVIVALLSLVLVACGGGLKKSATCDHAEQQRSTAKRPTTPAAPEQEADGTRSFEPVYCLDLADPFVLSVKGTLTTKLFVFGTSVPLMHIPVLIPRGLLRAERVDDALPQPAAWAKDTGGWAPSVLQRGDTFVLYYTITERASGKQCISLAVADTAEGPYQDSSAAPLVCPVDLGGAIDPSPFVDADGTPYLYWKNDGNCCRIPTRLFVQKLAEDGRSVVSPPTELLRADQGWEGGVIEAPSMFEADGAHFLFYSANDWSSPAYGIGYATCASPTGPCTKVIDRPWLGTSSTAAGPGGQELYVDGSGATRMVFHAWIDGKVGYADGGHRGLFTTGISIVNGAPVAKA